MLGKIFYSEVEAPVAFGMLALKFAGMGELAVEESRLEPPARLKTFSPVSMTQNRQPPLAILGVLFHPLGLHEAVAEVDRMIESGQPNYIVTANVDFLVQARKDLELRRILLDASLVLCDGTPLVWISRLLGNALPERVAGSDLAPVLLQQAAQKGHRVFFLGGEPQVTSKAVSVLEKEYQGLKIAGYYSPPFQTLLEMDHEDIAGRIRAVAPDVVLVSFGCPKAEKWMAMHYQSLGVPVMIGVGGTIDFLAGEKRRAPRWMQRSGTEWLFRVLQEPKRLASRYAKDFWRFLPAVARQVWDLRCDFSKSATEVRCVLVMKEPGWVRLRAPQRLDRAAVERHGETWERVEGRHCLVELDSVRFIDSTGMAWLLQLRRRLRASRWQLVLLDPSRAMRRALRGQQLDRIFLIARDVAQAREVIEKAEQEQLST
jgi:N-acetylglucosaminyldiphosphoundecaprenol N-acetyl-beta-D-mannosaminyltransferase